MDNHHVEWQNQLFHFGHFQEQTAQLPQGKHGKLMGESWEKPMEGELSEEALPAELLQGSLEPLVTNTLEECQGMVALFMVAEATLLKRSCWHCVLFKYGGGPR